MKRLILLVVSAIFFNIVHSAQAPQEASYKNNKEVLQLLALALNNNNNARGLLLNLNNTQASDALRDLIKSEQASKTNELLTKVNTYLNAMVEETEEKEKMEVEAIQEPVAVNMDQENNENADNECDICMYQGNKYMNHVGTAHPHITTRYKCDHCGLIKFTVPGMNAHIHRNHEDIFNFHAFNSIS